MVTGFTLNHGIGQEHALCWRSPVNQGQSQAKKEHFY